MTRALVAILFLFAQQTSVACEDFELPSKFKAHWQKNSVEYELPRGKLAVPSGASNNAQTKQQRAQVIKCNVVQDMNGDGKTDYAGIYHYKGSKKRSDDWSLDLIFMYSVDDRIEQVIFPYAGRQTEGTDTLRFYLVPHDAGDIDLMPGTITLERPALVAYRDDKPAVVYYWDGEQVAQQPIGVDD